MNEAQRVDLLKLAHNALLDLKHAETQEDIEDAIEPVIYFTRLGCYQVDMFAVLDQ